jgi:hypothetical protein
MHRGELKLMLEGPGRTYGDRRAVIKNRESEVTDEGDGGDGPGCGNRRGKARG